MRMRLQSTAWAWLSAQVWRALVAVGAGVGPAVASFDWRWERG